MADKVRFTPVVGIDERIKFLPKTEGRVYFATDTRKIYIDTDQENKLPVGGAGNSGIYYGTKAEVSDEEFESARVSFTLGTHIEGEELPSVDDLILNADGSFYRVVSINAEAQSVIGLRLTVAGSGGGGGSTPSGTTPSWVDIVSLDTSDFIYGQPAYLTLTPYSELDRKGEPLDKNGLTIRWKIIARGSKEYVEGTIDNLVNGVPVEFDFGSKLFADQYNDMEFRVEGARTTNMETIPYAVNCVKLALKQNSDFTPLTLYKENFNIVCTVEGQISKRLEFWFDGELLESRDLDAKDFTGRQALYMKNISHGSHMVEMKLFQTFKSAEGIVKGAEVPSLKFEIAVAVDGETDPIIWLGNYQEVYNNYDRIQIPYMVYTPGTTTSTVRLYKGAKEMSISPTTVTFSTENTKDFELLEIIDATVSNVTGELINNTYSITSGNAAPKFVNFKVLQTGKMVLASQNNLLVHFDSAGRSNNETSISRSNWNYSNTEAFGDKANYYKGEFEGFNWYNNGWVLDKDGNTCLRISNGAKFKIPLGNTTFNSSTQGSQSHTFEFQFKIRNIQNYEHLIRLVTRYKNDSSKYDEYLLEKENYESYEQFLTIRYKDWYNNEAEYDKVESIVSTDGALCNYYDTAGNNVGFCLGTQDAFFKTNESTLNCNYVENRMVNLSLVYQRAGGSSSGGLGLVSIYLNGVLSGAAKITDNKAFTVQNNYIVFNSDFCDIDLYKFRVYNTNLSIAEVLNNYAVDLRDVEMYNQSISLSKYNETTGEYEFDFNAMTTYNENNPDEYLMPYLVFSNVDAMSYAKSIYVFPDVQFVNPGLDRAYKTGELEKDAQNYSEADFPIAWITKDDAALLVAEEQNRSTNYFVTLDGKKTYIEKAKLDNYSTKIKKDKKKGFTIPVMRHLSKVENFYIHHSPSFSAKGVETNVQGTSSQYYPRRNYKIRCKEKMYADRGPFEKDPMYIQYFFMDNDKVGTTKFTMKIDYMESSGSYNTGFANLVHGAYTKHPLYDYKDIIDKPDTSYLRTNIMGFPMLTFHKKSADNTIFIGRYNMNLDKGSDENFGFKLFKDHDPNGDKAKTPYVLDADGNPMAIADVAECWEFSDNNRGYCSFRDPEQRAELSFDMTAVEGNDADKKAGYHTNSNGSCPAVVDSFEYRYHKDADVLDYCYKPDAELKESILEDYEGEITAGDLDDLQWRRNFVLEKMSNYEKLCKWVWSTNTEMVDSDSVMYSSYGTKHGGMTYSGETSIYDKASKTTLPALIYDLHEDNNIFYDDVWNILQTEYGFTEADMKTEKFGTIDEQLSNETTTVYTYTDEDVFQAYALVTGYTYKSYVIEEVGGNVEVRATFDVGTVKLLSEVTAALAANPKEYETDKSKALPFENGYKVGSTTYYFDTKEYRLAKFAQEFTEHFDKEYALVYFVMTEVFECYDSRGKNCMMASWGPQKENGEYIWYPIFYDIDTQLGINNTGIPSFEYYVNATQDGCYSTNDSVLWGNIYRCFLDDIKTYYQNLRSTINRKNDDGSQEPNSAPIAGYDYTNQDPVAHIENWYTTKPEVTKWYCCRGSRPLIAINMDEWYKYITIMIPEKAGGKGYQGMDGKPVYDSAGSFLYALQGDRGLSRQQFLMRRINFIDSWLTRGTYMEGSGKQIKFRTSANDPSSTSDFWIDSTTNLTSSGTPVEGLIPMLDGTRVDGYYEVDENGAIRYDENGDPIKLNYLDANFFAKLSPFQRSYVTLATDNAPLPSIEYEGTPVRMEFPSNVVTGVRKSPRYAEQLLYLYGADYLKDIGDVSLLYPREFELVGAEQLQRIILGNDHPDYYNKKLKSPKFDASTEDIGKPLLKEVVLTNVQVDDSKNQVLDFTSSEKLQIFRALGMNLATVKFSPGVALHTLHLPKTIQTLNLTEARNLKGIITSYNAPTAENLKEWKPQKGIYLNGITDVAEDQLGNADAVNNNLNTIEILGGNMGYDSYTLLKRLYDIKEAQSSASNPGNLRISFTGIHWSPYTQLEKGYEYNEEELDRYYIDNGHYQLVPYKDFETDFTWEENIANKYLYIKDTSINEDVYGAISTTSLLEDLANNTEFVTYLNPDEIGNEIPRISGDIYIHNTDEIEEGWIRNVLQVWYPNLNVFVQNVKKAYSAQFIQVDENDGTWTILETQKISQEDFAKDPNVFFTSPYETYSDMTQKDHYDFFGWSTVEDSAEDVIAENAWKDQKLTSGKFDYKFFIIYQKHPYEYKFYNDDNTLITWIENGVETSILKIPYQENLRSPLVVPISGKEASLPDDKIYKFLGYSKTKEGEVVDLTTISSAQDLSFYAVYDTTPMSVYDNFTYVDNADIYFDFASVTYNDSFDAETFSLEGYSIALKPGVTLKGKITLPSLYNGSPIVDIATGGFKNQNSLTHIYFQNKVNATSAANSAPAQIRRIQANAFDSCANLKIFEWPEKLRIIFKESFRNCLKLTSTTLPLNLYNIMDNAFQMSFGPLDENVREINLNLPGSLKQIRGYAFQGYANEMGGMKKIKVLTFGDEFNPIAAFGNGISINNTAFQQTNIDYIVIYCDPTSVNSWTSDTATKTFPNLLNTNNIKFPLQGDDISQIS